mgnify:CR=1 FL=1
MVPQDMVLPATPVDASPDAQDLILSCLVTYEVAGAPCEARAFGGLTLRCYACGLVCCGDSTGIPRNALR